jgi:pimeloyl-ACP methyl ester carboxylesterase
MNIIYLAGNSLNNKFWIEKVKAKFDSFSSGEILYYDHWQTGEKWINIKKESEKLAKLVENKSDYVVFSKSIGSVLALKGIYDITFKPSNVIICGHPYRAAKEENLAIDDYLKTLTIPTIFIQNEFDPVCSFEELEKVLKENSPADYQLIKNLGINTHDYEDWEKLVKLVQEFLLT